MAASIGARGITGIAMRCGFSTSQYFARRFRQYVGTMPSDFRRRCRAAGEAMAFPGISMVE